MASLCDAASSGEINGQVMELDPTCVTISEDGFITANSVGAARFAVVTDGGLRVIGGVVVTDQPRTIQRIPLKLFVLIPRRSSWREAMSTCRQQRQQRNSQAGHYLPCGRVR